MGHGVGPVVGKGEKSIFNSEGFTDLLCFSMEGEQRFSHRIVLHFDIDPLDSVSKPPTNGLEESLFGCKPNGKTFRRPSPFLAPDNLLLCKDSTKKEVSPTGHHPFDPFNIDNVDAGSNDHMLQFQILDCRLQI